MIRFLGYLFLLLLVATAAIAGGYYYLDRQASAFVTQSVRPIYTNWDFDALKRRASLRVLELADFETASRQIFQAFSGALGPLQAASAPKGGPEFGWKSDAEIRGIYASYFVQAKFERGEANLKFVLVKEGGAWRIAGFRVDSPAAMGAVAQAIRKGSAPSFQPGDPEETAAVTASATQVMACLESDAVGRCWDSASTEFKETIARQNFVARTGAQRAEWGLLQNRRLRDVGFLHDVPGRARCNYAAVLFETTFPRVTVEEKLLFCKQEGKWLLSAYGWKKQG